MALRIIWHCSVYFIPNRAALCLLRIQRTNFSLWKLFSHSRLFAPGRSPTSPNRVRSRRRTARLRDRETTLVTFSTTVSLKTLERLASSDRVITLFREVGKKYVSVKARVLGEDPQHPVGVVFDAPHVHCCSWGAHHTCSPEIKRIIYRGASSYSQHTLKRGLKTVKYDIHSRRSQSFRGVRSKAYGTSSRVYPQDSKSPPHGSVRCLKFAGLRAYDAFGWTGRIRWETLCYYAIRCSVLVECLIAIMRDS